MGSTGGTADGLDRARDELVRTCRGLAARGLVTAAAGNASVAVGDGVLLTGTGAEFAGIEPEDLTLVDRSGRVRSGSRPPTSELALHLAAYRLPGTSAVVHTHGRHAVAFSAIADVVPALHYYAVDLGGPVPVAPYRCFGTPELAAVTVDALAGRTGVVMKHHGSLVLGATLARAAARADLLEWLCEVALLARAAGPAAELSADQLEQVRAAVAARRAPGDSR